MMEEPKNHTPNAELVPNPDAAAGVPNCGVAACWPARQRSFLGVE